MRFLGKSHQGIIVEITYKEIAKVVDAQGPIPDYEVCFEDIWKTVTSEYRKFQDKNYYINKLKELMEDE